MLWMVTVEDQFFPVRAASHQDLVAKLEEHLQGMMDRVVIQADPLPDMAEHLAASQIICAMAGGRD